MEQQEVLKVNPFVNKFLTVLMTISTVAVTGTFAFLWRINADFAVIQEREFEKEKKIDVIQLNINQMRLDQQTNRENVIRLDGKMDYLLEQQKSKR